VDLSLVQEGFLKQEVFGMVQKALEDIMSRHNTAFLNSFRQMMVGFFGQVWTDILKVNQVLLSLANQFIKMLVFNRLHRA
jgi:hypothetical protein